MIEKKEIALGGIFFVVGVVCAIVSGSINSFLAFGLNLSEIEIVARLTPVVEEVIKMMAIMVFVILLSPKQHAIVTSAIAVGMGFGVFEFIYYVMQWEELDIAFLVIRFAGACGMHIVAGIAAAFFLSLLSYDNLIYSMALVIIAICFTSAFHAIYNLLIFQGGLLKIIAVLLPISGLMVILFLNKKKVSKNATLK